MIDYLILLCLCFLLGLVALVLLLAVDKAWQWATRKPSIDQRLNAKTQQFYESQIRHPVYRNGFSQRVPRPIERHYLKQIYAELDRDPRDPRHE